jgi:hypothetical protein
LATLDTASNYYILAAVDGHYTATVTTYLLVPSLYIFLDAILCFYCILYILWPWDVDNSDVALYFIII